MSQELKKLISNFRKSCQNFSSIQE